MLCAFLVVAAVPIEPMGFVVQRGSTNLVVVAVMPEGPAAAALEVGDVIEQAVTPTTVASATLIDFTAQELAAFLTPPVGGALVLKVRRGGSMVTATLQRTPRGGPSEFPTMPVPRDEFDHFPPDKQARYRHAFARWQRARYPTEKQTHVTLDHHPAVWVAEGHLVDGDGIAWTGDWVHLEGSMPWHCERSPMRQVLLTSTAPVPRIVVSSNDVALRGSSTAVSLPLWKIDAVVARCKTGPGELPSPPLEAELRCDGEAPVKQPLQVSLTVTCGRRETRDRVLDVLRLYGAELIVIGQATALTANLNWPWVRPAPVSATIVEVDPRGAVVGRRSAVLPARDEPEQVPFTLDLATPRNVTLAAELTFADGSTRLSEPQSLRIITRETNEREIQEFDEGMAELTELHQALTARRVCDDPAGAVRFLEGRPEVESASQSGKDISFITKRGMPSFVHCHVR